MQKLSNEELLALATIFVIQERGQVEEDGYLVYNEPINVEARKDRDGKTRWAVTDGARYCLNKKGKWEAESLPSGRTDTFKKRCRWAKLQDAVAAARKIIIAERPLYLRVPKKTQS